MRTHDDAQPTPPAEAKPFVPPAYVPPKDPKDAPAVDFAHRTAVHAARAEHTYKSAGSPKPPEPDDHTTKCPHENAFNACLGCMTHAGLSPRDIAARIKALRAWQKIAVHPVAETEG